jgi:hypothetical protein
MTAAVLPFFEYGWGAPLGERDTHTSACPAPRGVIELTFSPPPDSPGCWHASGNLSPHTPHSRSQPPPQWLLRGDATSLFPMARTTWRAWQRRGRLGVGIGTRLDAVLEGAAHQLRDACFGSRLTRPGQRPWGRRPATLSQCAPWGREGADLRRDATPIALMLTRNPLTSTATHNSTDTSKQPSPPFY